MFCYKTIDQNFIPALVLYFYSTVFSTNFIIIEFLFCLFILKTDIRRCELRPPSLLSYPVFNLNLFSNFTIRIYLFVSRILSYIFIYYYLISDVNDRVSLLFHIRVSE